MVLKKEKALEALIDGKRVIAYFKKNHDYEMNHLCCPIEIRVIGNLFCTYISTGTYMRRLKGNNLKGALEKYFKLLNIQPICILDEKPLEL